MTASAPDRVVSLDLIRGVAVLGILAINIAGFAGPPAAVLSPNWPGPVSLADKLAFAATFVLFEGKMRALFCMLFGASMALFLERSEAAGRDGDILQLRRLLWLAVFGLAHFFLLWWGDILFAYALCGIVVLMARDMPTRAMAVAAVAVFALSHLIGGAMDLPGAIAEERVRTGTANEQQVGEVKRFERIAAQKARNDRAIVASPYAVRLQHRVTRDTFKPLLGTLDNVTETIPLMLIGVVLFRIGFFSGTISRKTLWRIALAGTLTGLALTVPLLAWAWPRDFPIRAMSSIMIYWAAIPHLLMALGYAALLALAAPRLARSLVGRRLADAGRMAFTVYIGTSLVMTAIFYGWGLGLAGSYGHAALLVFVLFGWLTMLAASWAWLGHFRRGPLEWAWRSLVERRLLALRR